MPGRNALQNNADRWRNPPASMTAKAMIDVVVAAPVRRRRCRRRRVGFGEQ